MHGILTAQGHVNTPRPDDADVVIVNTCSFIAAARDETLSVLRDMAARKPTGQRLIAAGCMAESHGELVQAVPGVDATLSTREWMRIGDVIGDQQTRPALSAVEGRPADQAQHATQIGWGKIIPLTTNSVAPPLASAHPLIASDDLSVPGAYADWRTAPIRRTASGPSAYLKISDGCNLRCAFCTIPSFKGDMRSKAVGAILGEAQELVTQGVREIVLVAQHLTDYGRDLKLQDGLATLLDELCALLPKDVWLRLMYAYPHGITPRLIETMARHPQLCKYFDMPLQHAHPATLRRMRRPPDMERTKSLIREMRASMPDLAIRSTFIVGFPGETHEEFQALLAFLDEMELDRVGVFPYSQEPGTPAATLPDQMPARTIEQRWHKVMKLQQRISRRRNQAWIGRTMTVLVEGEGQTDDGAPLVVGRSFRDAPEVDGQVFAWGQAPVGSFVQVQVAQATDYDLWGEVLM